jgi:hypothetical protein
MVHDRSTGTDLEVKIGLVFDGARRTGRNRRVLTGRPLVVDLEQPGSGEAQDGGLVGEDPDHVAPACGSG